MFLSYEQWEKYKGRLHVKDLPKEIQPVYSVLDNFHNNNESKANLTVADLANLLVSHSSKDKDYYLGVLEEIQKLDVSANTTVKLIHRVLANKHLQEISLAAYEAKEGRMSLEQVNNLFSKLNELDEQKEDVEENPFISDDLEFLVEQTYKKQGLRWRLKTLNEMLGSLRKGDFGFVFARPETGKTTFLASEISFMVEQLEDADGPILWINNEEQSEKPMLRCIQATLGLSLEEVLTNPKKYSALYQERTKGKIKIIRDIAAVSRTTVENLCRRYKPSLLIFDQIDKIVGFEEDREDLKLGAIYQWARELAKEFCPVIGICQADGMGEGQKWLTMSHVANAKTSKQAEADWILGIGKVSDPGYDALRYLHLSKNKLLGDPDTKPDQRHGRREVLIEASRARYKDI